MEVPFKPFAINFLRYYDFRENITDALKAIKEEYSKHDLVVMNVLNKIQIDLVHPEIVK